MDKLDWKKLLNTSRFKDKEKKDRSPDNEPDWVKEEHRTEIERDFDRILFSTPTRRLADKTQVFPLDDNVSIRTRLTHSHEVANLARSIGTNLSHTFEPIISGIGETVTRDLPAILATIGLAHDIGNPPFGHQGEKAIGDWFRRKADEGIFFSPTDETGNHLGDNITEEEKNDFLEFEGNAQTLRVLTRLQVVDHQYGLNLTYASLAALMKYTIPSYRVGQNKSCAFKKFGFFHSERDIAQEVFDCTGLSEGKRHPLAYIMEACDDTAYSIMDAEDTIKKGLVSFSDLIAFLENEVKGDDLTQWVIDKARKDHLSHRELSLSPAQLNDVSMQKFRVYAVHAVVVAVTDAFKSNYDDIMQGDFSNSLMKVSRAENLCGALKKFDVLHGYKNHGVLALELQGYNTIHGLMDMLWRGISEREKYKDLNSKRTSPFSNYAFHKISENYRGVFSCNPPFETYGENLSIRYRELQLLTDMVSGMADGFAVNLYNDLSRFHVGVSAS